MTLPLQRTMLLTLVVLAGACVSNVSVNEPAPAGEQTLLVRGSFEDADSSHRGSGVASVYQGAESRILRLSEFKVTAGPDLEVWLVGHAKVRSASDVRQSKHISLGALKGNIGDQNYTVPDTMDLAQYESVVVWCEDYGVLFSSASLKSISRP